LPFGGPPPKPDNPQLSPPNQNHPHPLASSRPPQPPTPQGKSNRLYDIPPQYRQGATPIKDSQQKYGQPKYTHDEWRSAMNRAIRENYGIYDDIPQNDDQRTDPTNPNHPPKTQPTPPPGLPFGGPTKTTPPRESRQPRPPPLAASRPRFPPQSPALPGDRRASAATTARRG
jgi:hypothetical protein